MGSVGIDAILSYGSRFNSCGSFAFDMELNNEMNKRD
jgi:hypothetical protein